jgi:hypothetical protein
MLTSAEFQAKKITKFLSEMNDNFHQIDFLSDISDTMSSDYEYQIRKSSLENNFEYLSDRVYPLCLAYFEEKKLPTYLANFERVIKPFFESKSKLLSSSYDSDNDIGYSIFITEIWRFLLPFQEFDEQDTEQLRMRFGYLYLENLLESTAVIISEKKIIPNSEPEVYNAVKFFVAITFPTSTLTTESFQKPEKAYNPDILIPNLNCAIEYKFAKTKERLIKTVDEIFEDVHGYSNHPTYKIFYAVFYAKAGVLSRKRFDELWKSKNFPANWKGILVEGLVK